jgi:hypothetical protein
LSGFTVEATAGNRGIVASGADALSIQNVDVTNCGGAGIFLEDTTTATLDTVSATSNGTGLQVRNTSRATLNNYTGNQDNGGGLVATDSASVTSSSSHFNANNGNDLSGGVNLRDSATWSSSNDEIKNNARSGVLIATGGAVISTNTITMTGATISGNGTVNTGHGIEEHGASLLTLIGSTVVGNNGNGVEVDDLSRADLGSSNAGNNTLQAATGGNALAGVCNKTNTTVTADNDHFTACPPTTNTTCTGGVDIGSTSGGAVTSNNCQTP